MVRLLSTAASESSRELMSLIWSTTCEEEEEEEEEDVNGVLDLEHNL